MKREVLQSLSVCVSACLLRPRFSRRRDNIRHQSNYLLPLLLLYPPPLQYQKRQCLLMLAAVVKGLWDCTLWTDCAELRFLCVHVQHFCSHYRFIVHLNLGPSCDLVAIYIRYSQCCPCGVIRRTAACHH